LILVEVAVGYLRACIESGEISKRVFDLTEKVIIMNSTFVSAWYDSVELSRIGLLGKSVY